MAARTCFLFKRKRTKEGKKVASSCFYGRYRLPGDDGPTTIALETTDRQTAQAKLARIVRELEQEREGLLPVKAIRDGVARPLAGLLAEHVAEMQRLGRSEQYVREFQAKIQWLGTSCGWKAVKDITAQSFCAWRQKQNGRAKTLNEYLIAISALLNAQVRMGAIPANPLAVVQPLNDHQDSKLQRRSLTHEEARRLIGSSGKRSLVYWLAIRTGFRRNELAQLRWQDLHLDGPQPFILARASTTKNHKAAPMPVDDELAAALRDARPANSRPSDLVFARLIPRVPRFWADLRNAGIEPVNEAGKRVDFHALRMTFGTSLALNGETTRTSMELMRHSDPKLTTKTYTDAGLLPTAAAIRALPSLGSRRDEWTPEGTLGLVPTGQTESRQVPYGENGNAPRTLIDKGSGRDQTLPVPLSPDGGNGARYRVRTCDFLRVKQALYH